MKPDGYAHALLDAPEGLDATFAALADPTRRAILRRLMAGEATVGELAAPFPMSQPAVSKHLKVLERAHLISRGRDGQRRPCRLEPRALQAAAGWLDGYRAYWGESYGRLDALLGELQTETPAAPPADAPPETPAGPPVEAPASTADPNERTEP